jgi:SAM-dependent methyltransferase
MHERYYNREQYFNEQAYTTEKYVIPYIQQLFKIHPELVVAEIGCGEAGNLKPFLDIGCTCIGIDLEDVKIENGKKFFENHPNKNKLTLIAEDIYKVNPDTLPKFDLVVMRDTIEHIPHQEKFLGELKKFLKPSAKIFFAFPPWRMPFGGHQQICDSKFLRLLPYFHLLPNFMYVGMLKVFGETEAKIKNLSEVRATGISINKFNTIVKNKGYKIDKATYYLINPNYEIKFKLKQRVLPWFLNIPYLRDFFVTTYYSIISLK